MWLSFNIALLHSPVLKIIYVSTSGSTHFLPNIQDGVQDRSGDSLTTFGNVIVQNVKQANRYL